MLHVQEQFLSLLELWGRLATWSVIPSHFRIPQRDDTYVITKTAEERCTLISVTRSVLNKHSSTKSMPVIAGVAAPSTKETIALACAAAGAGADFAMVIPPGYYAGILKSDGMRAIKRYFIDVSEASPIPVYVFVWILCLPLFSLVVH